MTRFLFPLAVMLVVILLTMTTTNSLASNASRMSDQVVAISTPNPQYKKLGGAAWLDGHGVDVYYTPNQDDYHPVGPNNTILYECVELVVRLYRTLGYPEWRDSNGNLITKAYQMFDVALKRPPNFEDLEAYSNGGTTPPRLGDIVVWGSGYNGGFGHVAIVSQVTGNKVQIVQQNFWYRDARNNSQPYPTAAMTLSRNTQGKYTLTLDLDKSRPVGWIHSPKMEWILSVSGYYQLKSVHSQKCLDVTGASSQDGTKVIQWACGSGDNQLWKLTPIGNGAFRVEAKHSNKCLDVNGASRDKGANLIQYQCHSGDNQKWLIIPYKDNKGNLGNKFVAAHSQMCMDVSGASTKSGANVIQYPCNGGSNQTWWLTKK